MRPKAVWTQDQEKTLAAHYEQIGPVGCSALIGHSPDLCRERARDLGLNSFYTIMDRTQPVPPPVAKVCHLCGLVQQVEHRLEPWGVYRDKPVCPQCEAAWFRAHQKDGWTCSRFGPAERHRLQVKDLSYLATE